MFDADNDGQVCMDEWRSIAELTKKADSLSTYHNYFTWTMVQVRAASANAVAMYSVYADFLTSTARA